MSRSERRLRRFERAGDLRVDEEREAEIAEHGHGDLEIRRRDAGELVDAGRAEKALGPGDAEIREAAELARVAGDDSAPEGDVHVELAFEARELLLGRGARGGGRDAVEGHVHDSGDPARGRRLGGRAEALPLGAPRLVDVNVAVHDSGGDEAIPRVDDALRGADLLRRGDVGDEAEIDVERRRADAAGEEDAPADEDEIAHGACPFSAAPKPRMSFTSSATTSGFFTRSGFAGMTEDLPTDWPPSRIALEMPASVACSCHLRSW